MTQPEASGRDDEDGGLLSICALLRWFDRALLRALSERDDDEVEILLASDLVEPIAEMTGAWRLRDDSRANALERLRAERPTDELTWQTRIFEHFLREARASAAADSRSAAEEACLAHFGELFRLLAAREAWHTLAQHIAEIRAAAPRQPGNLDRLQFYEGFIAIRTQSYADGEARMLALLEQDRLEPGLRVQVLNALGQSHWFQTSYDRALSFYEQVDALAREIADRNYQMFALANMGMIYSEIGYYDKALDLTMRSLVIVRELGERSNLARTLYHIGNYAMLLGRWQLAQTYFHEAIALYQALRLQSGLVYLYWGQGFLYHMLGDEGQSEAAYLRAIAALPDQEQEQLGSAMDTWLHLGFLYQTQGRLDEALVAFDRAAVLAGRLGSQHRLSQIDYRRGNVFERQGRLDAAMDAYRAAIERIEALRGATRAEEIKIGLLGTVQQIFESTVLLCLACGRSELALEYVERARSRAFLDMLADKHPDLHDGVAQPVVTLAELQAALPAGALLVEYYTAGVLPRGEALINMIPAENARLREHLALPPQVIGFAVTRDRLEVFRPKIDPNTLRPQPNDPDPGRRLLRDRLLTHLHDQLIAPIGHLRAGCRQFYVIPHGPLHYVPFMALRSAAGAHLLDTGGPALALAPSATILLRSCLGRRPGQGQEYWALGYNDEGDEALRYAEAEAGHVARLLGGRAWAGPAPKSALLSEFGRRARWLHIAGHAIYDPHDPLGSALRLGAGDSLSARAIMGQLELGADLVTLSACTSGVNRVVPGDEQLGLPRALLVAGVPAVVCTLWEAFDLTALLVMDRFYRDLRRGRPPAEALRDAQVALREMTGRDLQATLERWRADDPAFVAALGALPDVPPESLDVRIYADPLYWAPFMLIGRPD